MASLAGNYALHPYMQLLEIYKAFVWTPFDDFWFFSHCVWIGIFGWNRPSHPRVRDFKPHSKQQVKRLSCFCFTYWLENLMFVTYSWVCISKIYPIINRDKVQFEKCLVWSSLLVLRETWHWLSRLFVYKHWASALDLVIWFSLDHYWQEMPNFFRLSGSGNWALSMQLLCKVTLDQYAKAAK